MAVLSHYPLFFFQIGLSLFVVIGPYLPRLASFDVTHRSKPTLRPIPPLPRTPAPSIPVPLGPSAGARAADASQLSAPAATTTPVPAGTFAAASPAARITSLPPFSGVRVALRLPVGLRRRARDSLGLRARACACVCACLCERVSLCHSVCGCVMVLKSGWMRQGRADFHFDL